jgi:hypothetical protein
MKAKEIFIVTESNPNMKDLDWQILLKTTLFENENDCDKFVENLIDNYINLYVECWNDYPEMLFTFNDKENNFYVDRFTWYLEWNNIVVKKSIRAFNS